MYHSPVYADAKANLPLLQDVVDFTRKFYPRSWAHFELCKPGTMLLQPSEHALPIMRADYQDVAEADGACDGLLAVGGDKIFVYSVVVPCNTH